MVNISFFILSTGAWDTLASLATLAGSFCNRAATCREKWYRKFGQALKWNFCYH